MGLGKLGKGLGNNPIQTRTEAIENGESRITKSTEEQDPLQQKNIRLRRSLIKRINNYQNEKDIKKIEDAFSELLELALSEEGF